MEKQIERLHRGLPNIVYDGINFEKTKTGAIVFGHDRDKKRIPKLTIIVDVVEGGVQCKLPDGQTLFWESNLLNNSNLEAVATGCQSRIWQEARRHGMLFWWR